MHAYERDWQRLPLTGTANTRELGGYPTADGRQTAWHRFLRSDVLSDVTAADIAFLRGYGVRLVLDLRGEGDAADSPDRPLGEGVSFRRASLADFNAADAQEVRNNLIAGNVVPGEFYVSMLANRPGFAEAIRAILEVPTDSCVLFHCQAGKDRTGMLAMLLLDVAGVDRQDCIANYAQTRENLMRTSWYPEQLAQAGAFRAVLDSLPETMAYAYDHVRETYGGAAGYLRECGITMAELAELRSRLLA